MSRESNPRKKPGTRTGGTGGGTKRGGIRGGGGRTKQAGRNKEDIPAAGARGAKGIKGAQGTRGAQKTRSAGRKPGSRQTGRQTRRQGDKIESRQVEGRRAVLELLVAGKRKVWEIYLAEDLKQAEILTDIQTIARAENVPINKVTKSRLLQIAHTDSPQGVVAKAAPLKPVSLENLATGDSSNSKKPFLLVVDGVVDTLNLGNLFRNAECAGITGVVLGKHRSAQITPAATKAAAGAIEYLPIALVSSIPSAIEKLKELKIWTIGLDGSADKKIYDVDAANEPLALIIGAEGRGLGQLTKKRVDFLASIPLNGRIQALNAAAATAVAAFEIQRRRS